MSDGSFKAQLNRLQERLNILQQEKVEAEFAYLKIINSPSWRLTHPLRMLAKSIQSTRAWLRLQKIKWQTHSALPSTIILATHHQKLLSVQVSEISLQVNNNMRRILIENINSHA